MRYQRKKFPCIGKYPGDQPFEAFVTVTSYAVIFWPQGLPDRVLSDKPLNAAIWVEARLVVLKLARYCQFQDSVSQGVFVFGTSLILLNIGGGHRRTCGHATSKTDEKGGDTITTSSNDTNNCTSNTASRFTCMHAFINRRLAETPPTEPHLLSASPRADTWTRAHWSADITRACMGGRRLGLCEHGYCFLQPPRGGYLAPPCTATTQESVGITRLWYHQGLLMPAGARTTRRGMSIRTAQDPPPIPSWSMGSA